MKQFRHSYEYKGDKALQFSEVFIVPQYSEVTSRSQVDTSLKLDENIKLDVPVISANMDTVTDGLMAKAMWEAGAIGAIHRFMTPAQQVVEFEIVQNNFAKAFVSIGVNGDALERASLLYAAGARYFVIDIAHGHSKMMKDTIEAVTKIGPDIFIMAGNVATPEAVDDLRVWGADAVKIGIGPGNVCTTKNVTGVTVPQFSAVLECCRPPSNSKTKKGNKVITIADGGVQEIGDIAKALGAGADLVMCGRMFAGCAETPGPRVNGKKIYRGMASKDAMLTIRADDKQLPTPEGISTFIESSEESVAKVVTHIKGGLRSSMSYTNARTLEEFRQKILFGIRT